MHTIDRRSAGSNRTSPGTLYGSTPSCWLSDSGSRRASIRAIHPRTGTATGTPRASAGRCPAGWSSVAAATAASPKSSTPCSATYSTNARSSSWAGTSTGSTERARRTSGSRRYEKTCSTSSSGGATVSVRRRAQPKTLESSTRTSTPGSARSPLSTARCSRASVPGRSPALNRFLSCSAAPTSRPRAARSTASSSCACSIRQRPKPMTPQRPNARSRWRKRASISIFSPRGTPSGTGTSQFSSS